MTGNPIVTHNIAIETLRVPQSPHTFFEPDRETERVFRDAMSYLVFKWQLFAQLIYSGMKITYTTDVPIAATDSYNIFLNPAGFLAEGITDILEIVFVQAHEVGHRVFNDLVMMWVWNSTGQVLCPGGPLPYSHELMNIAQDYRINAMLVSTGIGRKPKHTGLYDKSISEHGYESAVEIYEKLYKSGRYKFIHIPGGLILVGGNASKGKLGHGSFDIHLPPTPQQIDKDKGKREQEIVAAAQLAQKTQGTVPGAVLRVLDEIVHPRVPWQQSLKSAVVRKAGEPRLDWNRQNRRLAGRQPQMFYAKKGFFGAGIIAMVGDNSGSMGRREISIIAGEMGGICAELNPAEIIVFWCDAGITREYRDVQPEDMEDLFKEWKTKGVGGGGGTDFRPPFRRLEELGLFPDMLVYFTDGYGTMPQEPRYPVVWGCTTDHAFPFGDIVRIDIGAND